MLLEPSSNGPGPISRRCSRWCEAGLGRVQPIAVSTHEAALAFARDHNMSFYDAADRRRRAPKPAATLS